MRVLVTGGKGQLGWELQQTIPDDYQLTSWDVEELDITRAEDVMEAVATLRPELIINAAAYTAVDKAESESATAHAINTDGAANLATTAVALGSRLIHISTDFVFDGRKSSPYQVEDTAEPLSVYGASKLKGDLAVRQITNDSALIIRTSWVYSAGGNNFVKTMLRLMQEKEQLGVVADQIGTPTWAKELARALWQAAARERLQGILHWADAGVASWYDFAVAIQEEAYQLGLLDRMIPVSPLTTSEYPLPATRPAYSVLEKAGSWRKLGYKGLHWRVCLRKMLVELKEEVHV